MENLPQNIRGYTDVFAVYAVQQLNRVVDGHVHWRIHCRNLERVEHMASMECEPIIGVGGLAPSGVQGQSPWSGDQGAKPPPLKLKAFQSLKIHIGSNKFASFPVF